MNLIKIFLILALLSITNLTYSQETPENIRYNNEKLSVAKNGLKSILLPGWGNMENVMLYRGFEIGGIIITFGGFLKVYSADDKGEGLLGLLIMGGGLSILS
ncbi:MAG: hypothetical protein GQ534_09235, partial [Candidatus Delongbacteria bacterium]|nr:hypothetical protein [Candidatus Delongbacteria bacterium]